MTETETPVTEPAESGGRPGWLAARLAFVDRFAAEIVYVIGSIYAVAGTAYAVGLGENLRYLDERVYHQLATTLVDTGEYATPDGQPTAYRPPGYPFLLAAVDRLGLGIVEMRLLGVAALVGLIWLAFKFGSLVHSRPAGVLAALLTAGYPLLVFTAGTLYPQVHAAFLLLFGLYLSLRALDLPNGTRRYWYVAGAGLSWGVLILAVPTFGPSVLVVIGWLVWRHRRRVAPLAASLLVVTAVLPTAWMIRNAVVLDAFVPVSTNNGINLLLGNSEGISPGGGRVGDVSQYEEVARNQQLSEVEIDRFYRDQAWTWIRENPDDAGWLYVRKVVNNFSFRNELATTGERSALRDAVSAVSFYPLLALFALRVLLARRWGLSSLEKLLIGLVLGNVLLLAVFYTRLRFRVPLDAVMIISSAAMAMELLNRFRKVPQQQEQPAG